METEVWNKRYASFLGTVDIQDLGWESKFRKIVNSFMIDGALGKQLFL